MTPLVNPSLEPCPRCCKHAVTVVDSRYVDSRRRRRKFCQACHHRWGTVEMDATAAKALLAAFAELDQMIGKLQDVRTALLTMTDWKTEDAA